MQELNSNNNSYMVSVVVPTYKRDNGYLERCIESLLKQTYKNIEIIIVDDNEPSDHYNFAIKKMVRKYDNHSNIIYVKTEKNLGAALARNVGIERAKGDYITFLDDDDIYLPRKIEDQLIYMQDNDLDMSFTNLALYDSTDRLIDYRNHSYVNCLTNQHLIKMHVMHNLTGTPTYMFRTISLRNIGGFDRSILSEEYYLMEKAINTQLKIGYMPKSLVKAYRHKLGGESYGERKIAGERLLYKRKKEYFDLLSRAERRYTRCRYLAVMAVSYYRDHQIFKSIVYFALAFLSAPITTVKEFSKRQYYVKKYRDTNE